MPWYLTHYNATRGKDVVKPGEPHVGEYGTYVWARNQKQAETICAQRGLGERVAQRWQARALPRPEPRPSDLLRKRRMSARERLQVLHAATFTIGLWATARCQHPWDVLGDEGVLHSLLHAITLRGVPHKPMIERLRVMEREIPGYLSARDA